MPASRDKKKELLIKDYIKNMSKEEKQAYDIAKSHLESSFDVEKSIGFLNYLKILEK
jgi:DNA integrity scanning protein DisA with diadenylate cyclase activity